MPHRRGSGQSPQTNRSDFDVDAEDIVELLGNGAHLVGYSYGGVVSLVAAAKKPSVVWSLAVVEPPAFSVARGHPEVERLIEAVASVYASAKQMTPAEFKAAFDKAVGFVHDPRHLSKEELMGVRTMMTERPPWEANIELEKLKQASFPRLILSGKWNGAFEAVCDVLESRLEAKRVAISGYGHGVQHAGKTFNEKLLELWKSAKIDTA
jgi:pimeloyl-ACP methyl ester carboxylesterase